MSHCRFVYNLALETKIACYKANGTNLSAYDLMLQLTELKREYVWLKDVDSQALNASIKKIDKAFESFFSGKGYPKFKSKHGRQSFRCPNNARKIDFNKGLLTIPKIKDIPISISRVFEGESSSITISREPSGRYFASVLVNDGSAAPEKRPVVETDTIGIDVGIKDFLVLSNGESTPNPKHLKAGMKRLRCLQRRLSRKKKGSNNRRKSAKRVAIHHERIKNLRTDFLHKTSTAITKLYGTICVEDLSITNMVKNHKLASAIHDAGWGEFFRQLEYKCEWGGKNFLQVPRFFASTKTCNNCGERNQAITLADRKWVCDNCGAEHHRDTNAAINIKQYFLTNSPEGIRGEPVELLSLDGAVKQESHLCKRVDGSQRRSHKIKSQFINQLFPPTQ